MSIVQHHMLDAYRAAQRGEAAPPPPGTVDPHPIRTYREWRRFRSLIAQLTPPADGDDPRGGGVRPHRPAPADGRTPGRSRGAPTRG
ncbi:hypothetical protein IHE55_13200 [Streptomyces pactum]|uniref:Uncharacterized protein n=1 Tax=Streptomyces pactum TaxID=68249 RepID=A0ABS0NKL7_9ACTN|nr:hypothetical protein [Streptomyces pactum]MBH5335701.1 hypothetical protein [Streptomyces pactum]